MKASKLQNLLFFFYNKIIVFKFADFSRFPMTAGMPALWLPFVATTGKKSNKMSVPPRSHDSFCVLLHDSGPNGLTQPYFHTANSHQINPTVYTTL